MDRNANPGQPDGLAHCGAWSFDQGALIQIIANSDSACGKLKAPKQKKALPSTTEQQARHHDQGSFPRAEKLDDGVDRRSLRPEICGSWQIPTSVRDFRRGVLQSHAPPADKRGCGFRLTLPQLFRRHFGPARFGLDDERDR